LSEVVIAHDARDVGAAIGAALARLPLERIVRGKQPNETWASDENTSGVTQPDTLDAVLHAVRAHGPRDLVVTGGAAAYGEELDFSHA
jgi:hypothetical protein